MPKLNVQQNNQNIIQAFKNALAIGNLKGIIASDGNHNFSTSGTNPNLLDNWYFVGGGSQLGDGIFPINQRGQSSYSGGYGIDRWKCWQASTTTLTASGLTFATGASGDGLFQYFTQGFYESLYGKTVTVSAIINGQLYSVTGTASADCWIATQFDGDNYIGYICNGNEANFRISLNGGGRSATIQAAKLELGTVSTLANDAPPDFGEELRKCQRYLWVETFGANTPIASGIAFNTSSVFDFITPVPMRLGATIQITFNVTPYITYGTGNLTLASGVSTPTSGKNGNHLRVQIGTTADAGNLTEVHLLCGTETVMTVSCEL